MKPNDLLVITCILASKSGVIPAFKDLSQITGLSVSQCFDAIESLYEAQLLNTQRRELDILATEMFLTQALPFIFPAKVVGPTQGIPLTLSDTAAMAPVSPTQNAVWVWADHSGSEKGIGLTPLHGNVLKIFLQKPEWKDFFSCVEILRFKEHPLKAKAIERVLFWCKNLRKETEIKKIADGNQLFEAAAKIIAETGYRQIKFDHLAKQLNCTVEDLHNNFKNPENLVYEIGRTCVARANAHFGKMMMASPENKLREARESLNSFFQFLDINEDYFRLGLWFYVERMFQNTDTGNLSENFFDMLEVFFSEIPSERSARTRAILFANSWLTYAWFRWVEFPKMKNKENAQSRLKELRSTLVDMLN